MWRIRFDMAYTKIKPVKHHLQRCLDYTSNPKKTEKFSADDTHIKRYIDQGIPPICHCLPVSLNQHWVVPFKYTNGSGWDSNRDRFSNQCHRTDTNWQVNATKRACLSGRGYCPNAVHQPAGSLYTVQHNNGFPCAAYRYFDPSQQGQL